MGAYILRRLLLMIPTILGIMLVSFLVIQFAPGGPVEKVIAQLTGTDVSATARIGGGAGGDFGGAQPGSQSGGEAVSSKYRGAQGLDPEFIKELEKQFGFDKPAYERFGLMIWNYARFDFGESYFRDISVIDLILEKMPVSISLGAVDDAAVLFHLDPARHRQGGARRHQVRHLDERRRHRRLRHPRVPVRRAPHRAVCRWLLLRLVPSKGPHIGELGGSELAGAHRRLFLASCPAVDGLGAFGAFATTTLLTKNSFLDEIRKQYVMTARAKGLTERQVLYGHVFRNAMLIVVAGFPGAFISAFFAGSLLIETIFSLDGLGLLGFESVINRDYPIVFATLYIFSLLGLVVNLLTDLIYTAIDPRIDFESREV